VAVISAVIQFPPRPRGTLCRYRSRNSRGVRSGEPSNPRLLNQPSRTSRGAARREIARSCRAAHGRPGGWAVEESASGDLAASSGAILRARHGGARRCSRRAAHGRPWGKAARPGGGRRRKVLRRPCRQARSRAERWASGRRMRPIPRR